MSNQSLPYFSKSYSRINLPHQEEGKRGLRNAQIGAIHAIGSYFTLYKTDPALIVMPTGSGKTAVLILSAFLLKAKRVLVISSSILVRGQITHEFQTLETLKNSNVFHSELESPKVYELKGPIKNQEEWDKLLDYDVVIGIPNSIHAGIKEEYRPNEDLFDLILVDEAHHTRASTWDKTINAFPKAKKIYFTATPFRRDKKEIEGRMVYYYPLSRAYEDKIFGDIGYYPVIKDDNIDNDLAIAKKTEEIFNQDRTQGFEHYLIIRTDLNDHADKLETLYSENTSLKLKKIHSRQSYNTIQKAIKDLKDRNLDGVICVNMLGEGFDFPNLKIAAIHSPQKSLAPTLQFIGRFARTNAENIDKAKFIALESDIRIRNHQLYQENAIWNEIIINLSENRIVEEDNTKEVLDTFEESEFSDIEIQKSISLYNLTPYSHVKIYHLDEFDLTGTINITNHEIMFHQVSEDNSVALFITKEKIKPKWITSGDVADSKHHLFIIHYNTVTKLLFVHSSIKSPEFYKELIDDFCLTDATLVAKEKIHKVLLGLRNTRIFNLGLQNRSANSGESYITKAGSDTQNTVTASDGRMYANGHVFGTADSDQGAITIGYSSGAKVWSNAYKQLPKFIEWCKILSEKIVSSETVRTNSGIDHIPMPRVVDELPENIIPFYATWNRHTYSDTPEIVIRMEDEVLHSYLCTESDILIQRELCDSKTIGFDIVTEEYRIELKFSFESHYELRTDYDYDVEIQLNNVDLIPICEYLAVRPLNFSLIDFSSLINHNEHIKNLTRNNMSLDVSTIFEFDWKKLNTNITKEFGEIEGSDQISIHDALFKHLDEQTDLKIIIYDHGTGEIGDFLTVKDSQNEIELELFHVKGAGGEFPSSRVDDIYEVCGQACKSLIWTKNKTALKSKVLKRTRNKDHKFKRGNIGDFNTLIDQQKVMKFNIIIVQPGISKESIEENIATVLASSDDFIRRNGNNERLRIMGSISDKSN